jgi:hypothetical protein
MAKKNPKKSSNHGMPQAQPGGGGEGTCFEPSDLPEEATSAAPEAGAVPLGLPISDEEYHKLQRRARTLNLPPQDNAQEDPSASSEGG